MDRHLSRLVAKALRGERCGRRRAALAVRRSVQPHTTCKSRLPHSFRILACRKELQKREVARLRREALQAERQAKFMLHP